MLCPAKARWRDGEKNAVSAGQDSPRQPEIALHFCRREILVGNPLPMPSDATLRRLLVRCAHSMAADMENCDKRKVLDGM